MPKPDGSLWLLLTGQGLRTSKKRNKRKPNTVIQAVGRVKKSLKMGIAPC